MEKGLILVHDGDDAAVALADLKAGEAYTVAGQTVLLRDPIPFGHKVALREIRAGENVVKYGNPLGHATQDIHVGQHIHTHNMATNLAGHIEYTYEPNGTSLSALAGIGGEDVYKRQGHGGCLCGCEKARDDAAKDLDDHKNRAGQ